MLRYGQDSILPIKHINQEHIAASVSMHRKIHMHGRGHLRLQPAIKEAKGNNKSSMPDGNQFSQLQRACGPVFFPAGRKAAVGEDIACQQAVPARGRAGLVSGIVAPFIALSSSAVAVVGSQINIYYGNVSGLEVTRYGIELVPALMVAGGLTIFAANSIRKSLPKSKLTGMSTSLLMECGAAFTVAPVFNPNSAIHNYASGDFFLGFPIVLGMIGTGMIRDNKRIEGGLTMAAAAGAAYAVVNGLLTRNPIPAVYELMEGSAVGIWLAATSAVLLLEDKIRIWKRYVRLHLAEHAHR